MWYAILSEDNEGSLENRLAARTWADADPYVAAGVYSNVKVKPFKRVLP